MPLCVVQQNTIYTGAAQYILDDDKYCGYDVKLVLVYNSSDHYTSCKKLETPSNFTTHYINKVDRCLNAVEAATGKLVMEVGEDKMRPVLKGLQDTIQTFNNIW